MPFYYILLFIVISSLLTIFLSSKRSIYLKHQFEEVPTERKVVKVKKKKTKKNNDVVDTSRKEEVIETKLYEITETQILISGIMFGSIGCLISYFAFKEIRLEDQLNSNRFLLISFLEFVLTTSIVTILIVFNYIKLI